MTLISLYPLPNYIFTFKWALFVSILAGVRTFYYEATRAANCRKIRTVLPLDKIYPPTKFHNHS